MKTTDNYRSHADLSVQFEEEGYSPGPPASLSRRAQTIDRDCCQECPCEACGEIGLNWSAWHKGTSYRAVATCTRCDHSVEF